MMWLGCFVLLRMIVSCGEPPIATESQVLDILNRPRSDAQQKALAQTGRRLFLRQNCHNCHGTDGKSTLAPSLRQLYIAPVKLADGTTIDRDPAYLARSIIHPQAQVVAGYAQQMANYSRVLSADDVAALITYLHQYSPPPASLNSKPSQRPSSPATP